MFNRCEVQPGVKLMNEGDYVEMYLNNVWRPNLSVTGSDGFPPISMAGNVIRPFTAVRCSMRLPPTTDAKRANEIMEEILSKDPPNGAKVTLHGGHCGSGWCMKVLSPWLDQAIKEYG